MNIKNIIFALAIFQIVLLMNLIVSHSYFIHESDRSGVYLPSLVKKKSIFEKSTTILISAVSIKQIGIVSATQNESNGTYNTPGYSATTGTSLSVSCCKELSNGAICEDVVEGYSTVSCKGTTIPSECSQVSGCELGCCVDPISGTCDAKSPKGKCEANDGKWSSEQTCQIIECQKGCCILGSSASFLTEKTCERFSILYGFKKDFRDVDTELECILLSNSQERGACVAESGGCSFKTKEDCMQIGGSFYKDNLCSNPSLETSCTKQASVGCLEGKDEIYWFDSCGNPENIYNSDRNTSWNNGKVLSKSQSCNPTSSNANSATCGNCNRALSSACSASSSEKVSDGEFVCKSLSCVDPEGKKRENGESWCVYDSYIGDGKDTAGSEHWRAYCDKGTIQLDKCGDYRGRICVQSDMESGGKNFSIASCAANTAFECMMYNQETDSADLCNENEYCMIKNINIAPSFSFDFCTAKYPKGFNPDAYATNKKICEIANVKCSVTYKKGFFSGWSCENNCECERKVFSDKMNDFCISLGDCGSYINFKGAGTDNTQISGAPANDWREYLNYGPEHIDYSKSIPGKYAKSEDLQDSMYRLLATMPEGVDASVASNGAIGMAGKIAGGLGLAAAGTSYLLVSELTVGATQLSVVPELWAVGMYSEAIGVAAQSIGVAAAGFAIGAYFGSWLASSQGITGTPAALMTIAGGVVGAVALYAWVYGLASIPVYGWIAAIVAIVIIFIISLFGWGKTETRTVEFKCLPWEAPAGGSDCSKCQDDPLKPCTEYRCESLGQACVLLNPETEHPKCESLPRENVAPVISPYITGTGYKFSNQIQDGVSVVGEAKECISEFTLVPFTLKTDENAQCKFSFTLPQTRSYKDMESNYPIEGNAYTTNHTFGIFMPSLNSLSAYDVAGNLRERYGNMSMYVRCQDYWGNYNIDEYTVNFCVNSGPDLTPAMITKAIPGSGTILKYKTPERNASFYLNEPAECRYSNSSGKGYDEMENQMTCETDITKTAEFGWQCNTTIITPAEENKIYIKCRDQPWFAGTVNETNRNTNQQDYPYVLRISPGGPLNITYSSPSGKIMSGFEPLPVKIEVRTAGGADSGVADCYLARSPETLFFETHSKIHKQTLTAIMSGNYSIPIRCEDSVGNEARSTINFSIELDTSSPIVTRAYNSGSQLTILTNEKAECYYSHQTCTFDISNATSMTTALSTAHAADWDKSKTYYIKCKDVYGNANALCAIKVQPE